MNNMDSSPSLAANKLHISYREQLLQLADALTPYPFLREKENELRSVADNLQSPFNLAIFGRMKTGKSTLINSIIGRQLAITGVNEATATINRLTYATGDKLNQFTAHWLDSQPESFPLEKLQTEWNGTEQAVLDRVDSVSWLELYSDAPILRDIHITDTPGTGSTAKEHEKIAKQFINGQEADALLYVFSPTGRESDEADLAAFRAGCLPGSSLDNSIAVLHKWDHIFWDEDNWDSILSKARRVHNFMSDMVSAVIPISAPLALLSKTAPASFWQACADILRSFDDEEDFLDTLGDDEEWEDEAPREALFSQAKALGCPLPSFRIMLRHLYRNPSESPAAAVLELSGLKQLEEILDKQIFSVRAVIQQKQNCARARRVMNDVYSAIENELETQARDCVMMERVYNMLEGSDPQVQRWMDAQRAKLISTRKNLQEAFLSLDKLRTKVSSWIDGITFAHDLLPWLQEYERLGLREEEARIFSACLKSLLPNASTDTAPNVIQVVSMLPRLNPVLGSPNTNDKNKAANLKKCLMQWASSRCA